MTTKRYVNRSRAVGVVAAALTVAVVLAAAVAAADREALQETAGHSAGLSAGFVCVDGVFNSELMAPYDVLQHTRYRDPDDYVRCFIVTPDGEPFETFEGIAITPHYSFETAPPVDILVVPSTETSMTEDIHNEALVEWIRSTANTATWVISVCDGAFPLAATGALDNRSATTFPSDREALGEMFPRVDVRDDVRLVVDGKFITSVGGAMSYEPALYLVERLYGREHAERTARGLVWPWSLESVPHVIVTN